MNNSEEYRRYWAAVTERSEREVYVPETLTESEEDEFPTFEEFILKGMSESFDRRG